MKTFAKPMIVTILFGMLCALAFIPLMMGATSFFSWMFSFRLILWGYLVCYALGLAQWGKGSAKHIVFPLLILLGMSVLERSHTVFLLLYLGMFTLIRTSLRSRISLLTMMVTEALLCLGGGALIFWLNPQTNLAWALGIWMFFLIQSLYFTFPQTHEQSEEDGFDPFEEAYRRVEKILSKLSI